MFDSSEVVWAQEGFSSWDILVPGPDETTVAVCRLLQTAVCGGLTMGKFAISMADTRSGLEVLRTVEKESHSRTRARSNLSPLQDGLDLAACLTMNLKLGDGLLPRYGPFKQGESHVMVANNGIVLGKEYVVERGFRPVIDGKDVF